MPQEEQEPLLLESLKLARQMGRVLEEAAVLLQLGHAALDPQLGQAILVSRGRAITETGCWRLVGWPQSGRSPVLPDDDVTALFGLRQDFQFGQRGYHAFETDAFKVHVHGFVVVLNAAVHHDSLAKDSDGGRGLPGDNAAQ